MRTVIVDDDGLVAISLKTILEAQGIEVAATGNDGKEAIELYHQYHPDVLLMDIQMKEMSGLEAAEQILIEDAEAKILFLTTFSDDEYIVKALNIGAKGYILKQDFEGIAPAMQAVERGQSVFGGEIVHKIPVLMQSKEEFDYEKFDISEIESTRLKKGLFGEKIEFYVKGKCIAKVSTNNQPYDLLDKRIRKEHILRKR